MDKNFVLICIAVLLDGLVGLSGGLLPAAFVQKHIAALLAFAAGTLTATAFLELLPEALAGNVPAPQVMMAALIGFFAFYVVENFLGSHAAGQSGHKHSTIGPLILVGDAIHNASDGLAIAAAFIADWRTGIATSLAVIVHELPQEIGDFSILVSHGYSRSKALFYLFLVQLSAFIGAFGMLAFASTSVRASFYSMALSAGGFLYIASADLLPELQRQKRETGPWMTLIAFVAGLAIIAGLQYWPLV